MLSSAALAFKKTNSQTNNENTPPIEKKERPAVLQAPQTQRVVDSSLELLDSQQLGRDCWPATTTTTATGARERDRRAGKPGQTGWEKAGQYKKHKQMTLCSLTNDSLERWGHKGALSGSISIVAAAGRGSTGARCCVSRSFPTHTHLLFQSPPLHGGWRMAEGRCIAKGRGTVSLLVERQLFVLES
jgi:hypothetical protein